MSRGFAVVVAVLGASPGAGAAEVAAPATPHSLVTAAELLVAKNLPEAAKAAVLLGVTTPGLTLGERARLRLVDAMLLADAHDESGARGALSDALKLDRSATLPPKAPVKLKGWLEDVRALLPRPSAVTPAPGPTVADRDRPAKSLLALVDELFKSVQLEGANLVLQLAQQYQPLTPAERTALALRRGLLKMETFEAVDARRAFLEALQLDRTATLPEYASPKAVRMFEELQAALPRAEPLESRRVEVVRPVSAPASTAAGAAQAPSARTSAWLPAAGGAAFEVAGGFFYWRAKVSYDRLAPTAPPIESLDQVHDIASAGRAFQTGAFVLFGAGAVALASAAIMFFGAPPGPLHASFQMSAGAVNFGIAGALP